MSDPVGAPAPRREYGVLLPQFGSTASRTRLLDTTVEIERMGFDSVWVRDHIVYKPHTHKDQDKTHVDCFAVLAAVAAVTTRIKLCTGVLIPHRPPIQTALLFCCLDFLACAARVVAGLLLAEKPGDAMTAEDLESLVGGALALRGIPADELYSLTPIVAEAAHAAHAGESIKPERVRQAARAVGGLAASLLVAAERRFSSFSRF